MKLDHCIKILNECSVFRTLGEANIQQQQKNGKFFVVVFQAGRRGEKVFRMEKKLFLILFFHLNRAEYHNIGGAKYSFWNKSGFQQIVMIFIKNERALVRSLHRFRSSVVRMTCFKVHQLLDGDGGAGFCSIHLINIDA